MMFKDKQPPDSMGVMWIDDFISRVKSYIFVRLEDNILIKRPNEIVKLNASGARILHRLLGGSSIQEVLKPFPGDYQKISEIVAFLKVVKRHLEGKLCEFSGDGALEIESFKKNFNQLPVLSEIALTNRCNLHCLFCYAHDDRLVNRPIDDLPPKKAEVILEKIFHQAKVPSVSFTGGEPTLYHSLPRLISFAKKLGMRVNLISNGTLITSDLARRLKDHGLDSAQISLEGVRESTHDSITGQQGSFRQTVKGIHQMLCQNIPIHSNTTINRLNLDECHLFPRFVQQEFAISRFSMNLMMPAGKGASHDPLLVHYPEIGLTLERILIESHKHRVKFMWYSPVPMCMFNSISHQLGNKGCSACDGLLSVTNAGDVIPCSALYDPVGNLIDEDFAVIWNRVKAQKYRDKTFSHSLCQRCDEFSTCHGSCPIYWRHLGYKDLIPFLERKNVDLYAPDREREHQIQGEME